MVSLKYAKVERERRFLLRAIPEDAVVSMDITDYYVDGSRLRLREVCTPEGRVTRKLTHKVRIARGPAEVACTNFYLDVAEWNLLLVLPHRTVHKRRYDVERDGVHIAVDVYDDDTIIAEIDDGDGDPIAIPDSLGVLEDVSDDERWTGAGRAR